MKQSLFMTSCLLLLLSLDMAAQTTVRVFNMNRGNSLFRTRDDVYLEIPSHNLSAIIISDTRDENDRTSFRYTSQRALDTLSVGYFKSTGLYEFRQLFYDTDDSTHFAKYIKIKPEDSLHYILYQLPARGLMWVVGKNAELIAESRQYIYCYSSSHQYSFPTSVSILQTSGGHAAPHAGLKKLTDSLSYAINNIDQELWKKKLEELKKKYVEDKIGTYQFALYMNVEEGLRVFVTPKDISIPQRDDEQFTRCKEFLNDVINLLIDTTLSTITDSVTKKRVPVFSKELVSELEGVVQIFADLDPNTIFYRTDTGNAEETLQDITNGSYQLGGDGLFAGFTRKNNADQLVIAYKINGKKSKR